MQSPVQLIHDDCIAAMSRMPENSVDAIVTDPPFGIGFMYASGREQHNESHGYWEWLRPRYKEMLRLLKPGGLFAMWQAQAHFRHFWTWFGEDIHIYCAAKNFVQMRCVPIQHAYQPVVMFYKKGGPPLHPSKDDGACRPMDFFVANTANTRNRDPFGREHPCCRPLDQVREIVKNFVVPSGVVLDPFAGSGTTLHAAALEGRGAIGIEIEPEYVEIAQRRIEYAKEQCGAALF